jgi:outer membrane lipoprotein-sorting protein
MLLRTIRKAWSMNRVWGGVAGLTMIAVAITAQAQVGNRAGPPPGVLPSETIRSSLQDAEAIAQVRAHLNGVRTMTARFTQRASNGKMASGIMQLSRPGKVRFQYTDGSPLLVVANNGFLSVVDYQVRQVSRWPINDTPLGVLLDPKTNFDERARITRAGPGASPNMLVIEATDRKRPEYGAITLYFERRADAPAGLGLAGWQVLDAQGNTTVVQLTEARFNQAIAASAFTFKDPRGPVAGPRSGGR